MTFARSGWVLGLLALVQGCVCARAPQGGCTTDDDCDGTRPSCNTDGGFCVECVRNLDCQSGLCDTDTFTCAAGGCGDACGDGVCCAAANESSCSCPADCGDETCGNGHCCATQGEDACGCAADCEATCGDACCTGAETPATCSDDCPKSCGNGTCDPGSGGGGPGESACSCPADCADMCGDGCCTGSESSNSCKDDCVAAGG